MINDDPNNKGLSASIITDASGEYLVLNANETGEELGRAAGADAYLTKPIKSQVLLKHVRQILGLAN